MRSVTAALDERFPDIPIYGDEIIQGLQEPAFHVKAIVAELVRQMDGHAYYITSDIRYFDRSARSRREMADQIGSAVERITLPWGSVWAERIRSEDVDQVLHVIVDYVVRVVAVRDDPYMMRLKEATSIGE